MALADWALLAGGLLLVLVLSGTLVSRLPLSGAMLYLGIGAALGPWGFGLLRLDPVGQAASVEVMAEIALLVSLFAVGLQLGVPLRSRRWWLPLRLAFVSMALMVALVAAIGHGLLGLSPGAAVLLGAILAPTDPVLASGIHAEPGARPDRLGFSLAGEGALNDGAAFPFVMLGLGLLGLHDLGPAGLRWWSVDLLWSTLGGTAIGGSLGAATGWLIVHLRTQHREALGLDMFIGLGLIAFAYGAAQRAGASGFLAVFAAGVALKRVRERPTPGRPGSHHASAAMSRAVQLFNGQVEKLAELALVVTVGAMLAYAPAVPAAWWFVPLLLALLRPLSTLPALRGQSLTPTQGAMVAWFGIRGIGSVYYMAYAIRHGVEAAVALPLLSLTLWTVATSIVLHGLTARPLMRWYSEERQGIGPADDLTPERDEGDGRELP